ncbi:MAG: calycin-like domain-containing protein [Prevotellaceae bacterium]|jgi:hypothetical protein|nr:calycin-like domain-containing protein [Prevotellaceae bacterium]
MKTLKWMTLLMAIATMPLFTGCSKDDDKNDGDGSGGGEQTATDVSGTYDGTISAMDESSDATSVLKKTDNSYSLSFTNLNIAAMNMIIEIGDVTIPKVTVSSEGKLSGGEKISKEVTLPPALVAMSGMETATVDVTLTSGEITGNNLKFELNVFVVVMNMNVPVNFDGNLSDDNNDETENNGNGNDKEEGKNENENEGEGEGDGDEPVITIDDVSGIYTGKISSTDATSVIRKTGDNYSLLLTDLSIGTPFGAVEIGNVTVENVAVSEGKLSGGNKVSMEVALPQALAAISGMETATVDITLTSGEVSGNNLKFELNVYVDAVKMNIPVNFDGNK